MSKMDLEEIKRKGAAYLAYLDQGETWIPRKPAEPLPVAAMDATWRYNAARWMERRASTFAFFYTVGLVYRMTAPTLRAVIGEIDGKAVEAGPRLSHMDLMSDRNADLFDEALDEIMREPLPWLRSTTLYRALVDGLPVGAELVALGERARHWSACPARAAADAECLCKAPCDRKPLDCLICNHTGCGSCPDCSPRVPEWTTA